MKISDIANRKFSRAFMGYNIGEVDAFLDEIAKDIERREQDIKLLELRNEMLIERLAASGVSLSSVKTE
ncbi:MAG: DivIVA domain-containing protein [Clostridia bacterium]|nr:DivIVA domain-containing protein [Clostridia bacterium]